MTTVTQYRISRYGNALKLGMFPFFAYLFQGFRNKLLRTSDPYKLYTKDAAYPIYCRPKTSDIHVFHQVFIDREYACVDDLSPVGLIIDCGANVGYSTAYFLSLFPDSHVIAIEPDPDNFRAMERNLSPFGNRYSKICSAIWSHTTGLVLSEDKMGVGKEWSRTVREALAHETPDMMAVDIESVLAKSGFSRISILKVDIEGAEAVVFSPGHHNWLEKVDCLVIELHGDHCKSVVMSAISAEDFSISHSGELTVCKRIPRSMPNVT